MSDHYYTQNPQSVSSEAILDVTLRGHSLSLMTDRGVFSKDRVDFGTALLLEHVVVAEEAQVLDVGCGYGAIGLALAAESARRKVTMVDVNDRALELTRKNARRNRLTNVEVLHSDLFQEVKETSFDVILTNPPVRAGKDVVHQLFEQSFDHLQDGGCLWVVIQKKQGAPSAFTKLNKVFDQVQEIVKSKGYRVYKAEKAKKTLH